MTGPSLLGRPATGSVGPAPGLRGWLRLGWLGLLGAIDDLAFPRTCPLCEDDAECHPSAFCAGCRAEVLGLLGPSCPRCAMPVGPFPRLDGGCSGCRGRGLGFDSALALGPYDGPIRTLCLRLKHHRDAWLARWVAGLVAEAHGPALRGIAAEAGGLGPTLVPIPLHWTRRLARGYNQAEALAVGLARSTGWPVAHALRRPARTPPLARAGRTERARVMRDAFAVRPRWRGALAGRTVVLVDDILTSGATAGAAGRALRRAGASRVVVLVVARAEGRP